MFLFPSIIHEICHRVVPECWSEQPAPTPARLHHLEKLSFTTKHTLFQWFPPSLISPNNLDAWGGERRSKMTSYSRNAQSASHWETACTSHHYSCINISRASHEAVSKEHEHWEIPGSQNCSALFEPRQIAADRRRPHPPPKHQECLSEWPCKMLALAWHQARWCNKKAQRSVLYPAWNQPMQLYPLF